MLRLLFAFCVLGSCSLMIPLLANLTVEYDHSLFLDGDEVFKLYWTVKDDDKSIHFAAEVKTTGWVGFGITQRISQSMKGADIVIGWVDSKGKGHLSDRHAASNSMPLVDQHQDYELTGASQDNGITVLKFKRKLKTCDKNDKDIPFGTTKVIYAYEKIDDVKYHGFSTRGAKILNLMAYVKNNSPAANMKHFDVTVKNVSVPKEKTTFYCEGFKLSSLVQLDETKHIIEITQLVEKKDRGLVHQMVIFSCQNDFDESHLSFSGPCYQPNTPYSVRQCVDKVEVFFAWAVGGGNFKFPDKVGFPIGAPFSPKYVILMIRFNNPTQQTGAVVTSGLRFYYEKPRKYEAAILTTGVSISGAMVIPPRQNSWIISGYCRKECSAKIAGRNLLNGNEIKMFASCPHAHTASTGIWSKHARNGIDIDEIIRDENYDFNYQQTYRLKKELSFKAGDELITYCRYNTTNRKDATVAGLSSTDEMCLNFIMYYPRANISSCLSEDSRVYTHFSKYAARLNKIGISKNKSGTSMPQHFSNWTNVKWNETMLRQLKNIYLYDGPNALEVHCRGAGGLVQKLLTTKQSVIVEKLATTADVCTKFISAGAYTFTFSMLLQVICALFSYQFLF